MNKRRSHHKIFSTWYYHPEQQLGPQCDMACLSRASWECSPTPPEVLPTACHDCMVKDCEITQDDLIDPNHAQ